MLFTSLLIHNFPEGLCVVRAVTMPYIALHPQAPKHKVMACSSSECLPKNYIRTIVLGDQHTNQTNLILLMCCLVFPRLSFLFRLQLSSYTLLGRVCQGISGAGHDRRYRHFYSQRSRGDCN